MAGRQVLQAGHYFLSLLLVRRGGLGWGGGGWGGVGGVGGDFAAEE